MRQVKDSKRRIKLAIGVDDVDYVTFELSPSQCKRLACDLLDVALKRFHYRKMATSILTIETSEDIESEQVWEQES